ncbi:MAG: citrate (Si)-synthase, partial [Thermoplasmata archaeon]|nr:citrate (Si)-synthase [Thermoplasmata archaeon]
MTTMERPDLATEAQVARLLVGERELVFPIEQATEGQAAINIAPLLKDAGLVTLDYGYANTAPTRSAITYLDGDNGILRYRGYPIEELAERTTFLETAYLLIHGELPTAEELDGWVMEIKRH